jgi:large subunit ribosomal protein L7e
MDVDQAAQQKAVLQPRRPGETIKVAETVLKRRDRNLKDAAERAAKVARIRKQQRENKKGGSLRIIRAERLVKNSITRMNDRRRLKNKDKKPKESKPRPKGKMLAAVRNGRLGGEREVKATLRGLGLGHRHSLVFLPNTEETTTKLLTCKPFVFWGPPSFKTVFNIVHKKAAFRDPDAEKGDRTMLSDNTLIEKHLGEFGVLCTEDLAHVLHTRSKHFTDVTARLWPVPLGNAKKANGMVHDKKFTFGDLQGAMDLKLAKLLGE